MSLISYRHKSRVLQHVKALTSINNNIFLNFSKKFKYIKKSYSAKLNNPDNSITKIISSFIVIFSLISFLSVIFLSSDFSSISENILKDEVLSKIISFESLHFTSCYKQGLDTSCGIATTATFLRFFYNINLDEKKLIEQFFEKLKEKKDFTISMLDIKNILEYYGFTVKGVKVTRSQLLKYSMYAPIILHFEKPLKHFTIFSGFYGQYIFLVDPSIGVHFIDSKDFDSKFSGYALFVYGKDELKRWDIIHRINEELKDRINHLLLLSNTKGF